MNFHLRPRGLTCVFIMLAGLLWRGVPSLRATDRYVSLAGTNDVIGGYTNWAGAATNIQWAVDKATNSETVWVSNGTYYSSGVTTGVVGGATNIAMVIITNAITVRSFSGSYTDTVVNGNWPAYTNRVFLVSNALAVVSGLTITNGYMFTNANGGGVYICDGLLSNCLITGNTITNSSDPRDENYYSGAGVYIEKGTVSYCIMKGNSCKGWRTPNGAGLMMMVGCTIEDCIITANSGGSALYTKNNIVNRCKVYGNTGLAVQAAEGGGTWTDCVISNNTSHGFFTGGATLRNCLIVNNGGDGAQTYATYSITLQNCTFVGNAGKGLNFAYNPAATYKAENTISYYNGIGATQRGCAVKC